jgi:hypothetical protein
MHSFSENRQIEIHIIAPLVPELSALEVEIRIRKLRKYKSPGSNQMLAEMIQAGSERLLSDIPLLSIVHYCTNLQKGEKMTAVIIVGCHCYQHNKIFY